MTERTRIGYKLVQTYYGKFENIPETWRNELLENILEVRGRIGWKGLSTEDYREKGPILIGVTNISKDFHLNLSEKTRITQEGYDESPEIMVQNNDILLAKSGATTGKICLIENLKEPSSVNAAVNILRIKDKSSLAKFIYFYLSWKPIQNRLFSLSSAGAQPNLFQRDTKKLKLFLPTKDEQEKIVSILSNIDDLIEKNKSITSVTENLKKGLMQTLFIKGIKHKKFKKVKWWFGKEIEIPEKWKIATLDELKIKTTSGGTPNRKNKEFFKGNKLWIKSGELNDHYVDNSKEKITSEAIEKSSAKEFPENTVLIAMYGATIGKTAILKKPATTNQAICGIPPNDVFEPYFLQQFFLQNKKILISFGMGAGQPNINQDIIRKFKYFVPPLEEQQKIALILNNTDQKISILKSKKCTLELLKKGLMQKLLTGTIDVKV